MASYSDPTRAAQDFSRCKCGSVSFHQNFDTGTRTCVNCRAIYRIGGGPVVTKPETPPAPACGNCRFSRPHRDRHRADRECRRNAPQPGHNSLWPTVNADSWCGEYQRGDG